MGRLYSFRADGASNRKPAHWLAISCSQDEFPATDFWDDLTNYVGENLRPDAIIFLVRENAADMIEAQLKKLLHNESEWRIPIADTTLWLACYNAQGRASLQSRLISGPGIHFESEHFENVLRLGLIEVFIRRNGLIRPQGAAHFVHPSGKHSQAFIRVANLMLRGPEVAFVAIGLLRYLTRRFAYICVDTSSIAPIAYALVQLKQAFDDKYPAPTIDSFLSWGGVKGEYSFPLPTDTLALVSASTSGNLAKQLISKTAISNLQVVTLYSLAKDRKGLQILSDLSVEDVVLQGETLEEHRDTDCPLCLQGSQAVHFVGDQFLADDIRHNSVEIIAKDAPDGLADFMAAYYGQDALGMQMTAGGQAVNAYHIDVERLQIPAFIDKFKEACRRYLPASTALVVHEVDPASKLLAETAVKAVPGLAGITVCDRKAIAQLPVGSVDGAVVITTGCTSSGSLLQSISRDLRDPANDLPRVYLIGFSKHSHLPAAKTLKSDLVHSSTSHKHHYEIIEPLVLPLASPMSAWEAERLFMTELTDLLKEGAGIRQDVIDAAEDRISQIDELASGNVENFFWKSPMGDALRLRRTFAFWNPGYDPERASQGDVLMTIASVLENMRNGSKSKLFNNAFHHSVIAPGMFGRYNDGIIQSSMLRAARPHELDYSADAGASNTMARLLATIVEEWQGPRGEAAMEFLIALATERLKLKPIDVLSSLPSTNGTLMPPMLWHLVGQCRKNAGG